MEEFPYYNYLLVPISYYEELNLANTSSAKLLICMRIGKKTVPIQSKIPLFNSSRVGYFYNHEEVPHVISSLFYNGFYYYLAEIL
jgi:hypothetical protein